MPRGAFDSFRVQIGRTIRSGFRLCAWRSLVGGRIVANDTHEALLRDVPEYAEVLTRSEAETPELGATGGGGG